MPEAVLVSAGLKLGDIGLIELNEAFAAQSLAVIRTLGLILPRWGEPSLWDTRWAAQEPN